MDTLLKLLERINCSELPDSDSCILTSLNDCILNTLIDDAALAADDVLIDANGRNIVDNHVILKHRGYNVFPGECDRFGWLSGCIQTKKGIIVYG